MSRKPHRTVQRTALEGALCAAALVATALAGPVSAEERVPSFVRADADATAIEIAGQPMHYETASSNGAADLAVTAVCSETRPRAADVTMGWTFSRGGVEAVRVDLTRFGRGFANGDYLTSGVLDAAPGRELYFPDADPGTYYYWRLLTRGPDGWSVAANGRFEGPVCPFDSAIE